MNKNKNIYLKFYPILVCIFCVLFLLIIILININIYKNKTLNHFLGENSISFQLNEQSILNENTIKKIYNLGDNFSLSSLNIDKENNVITNQIFIKGKINTPQIINGRFINSSDFEEGKKYAVVGKNILNSDFIYEISNELFYEFNNEYYKVIGVFEESINEALFNEVYITLNNLSSITNNNFTLSSNNSKNSELIYSEIKNQYPIKQTSTLENVLTDNSSINHQIHLTLSIIIFILILNIFFMKNFYNIIVQEIKIKLIIGFNRKKILTPIIKKTIYYYITTYFLSMTILILIHKIYIIPNRNSIILFYINWIIVNLLINSTMLFYTYKKCENNILIL